MENKQTILLFSYGTLMLDEMRERFNLQQMSSGFIEGYKVVKDGHLKCIPTGDERDIVTGMIFQVPLDSVPMIDAYEGRMYEKKQILAFTCGNITGDSTYPVHIYLKKENRDG